MAADNAGAVNYQAYTTRHSLGTVWRHVFITHRVHSLWQWLPALLMIFFACMWVVSIATKLPGTGTVELLSVSAGLLFVGLPASIVVRNLSRYYARARRQLVLEQFTKDNGWQYHPILLPGGYGGAIFNLGHGQQFHTVVTGQYQALPFELGNYTYTEGSGKNQREYQYGVIRVQLTRQLPHILLDGKANNSFFGSNLPGFRRDQRLKLEGDFNDHFDLYVPSGYERDALYFITPELMQLLIDYGAAYDIELVDSSLFIYQKGHFALEKQSVMQATLQLVATIGSETQDNTRRYADAAVGNRAANMVAEPGRRLRKAFPWVVVIAILAWILFVYTR